MKYTDFQLILRFENMIFKAKQFFENDHYIRQYSKFRRRFGTLGDAGRKKYFKHFFVPFWPKNEISRVEHDFSNFVYFLDRLFSVESADHVFLNVCSWRRISFYSLACTWRLPRPSRGWGRSMVCLASKTIQERRGKQDTNYPRCCYCHRVYYVSLR